MEHCRMMEVQWKPDEGEDDGRSSGWGVDGDMGVGEMFTDDEIQDCGSVIM